MTILAFLDISNILEGFLKVCNQSRYVVGEIGPMLVFEFSIKAYVRLPKYRKVLVVVECLAMKCDDVN